jgi:hypothetical protein
MGALLDRMKGCLYSSSEIEAAGIDAPALPSSHVQEVVSPCLDVSLSERLLEMDV